MAEHFEVFKRFEYRQNSNLVLQKETSGAVQNEPTGEPETLAGRLSGAMGDKLQFSRPPIETLRKRKGLSSNVEDEEAVVAAMGNGSKKLRRIDALLRGDRDAFASVPWNEDIYVPTSESNSLLWDNFLSLVQRQLSDQPRDVLEEAGTETLRTLRMGDSESPEEKLQQIQTILPSVTMEEYTQLYQIARNISDWNAAGLDAAETERLQARVSGVEDALESTVGVAVVFQNEDEDRGIPVGADEEEEDENANLVMEDRDRASSAEEDEGTENEGDGDIATRLPSQAVGADIEDIDDVEVTSSRRRRLQQTTAVVGKDLTSEKKLSVSEVGPHWLQRQLRELNLDEFDPNKLIATEKEILATLQIEDLQECENGLVMILGFDHFEMIKTLTRNRWVILYMTHLGQAQTEEEKNQVKQRMATTPGGQEVLEELELLKFRRDKEQDFALNVKREAAALKGGEGDAEVAPSLMKSRLFSASQDELFSGPPQKTLKLSELEFPLDDVSFNVEDVKLPEGTERISTKNYDEIAIPPLKQSAAGDHLAISDCLPKWAQETFSSVGVERLNLIQSKVFDAAFNHPERNLLVCAPTGAGKTNVAMLTILSLMQKFVSPETGVVDVTQFKVVYVSPMKALVAEQVAAFQKRLDCFGNVKVRELTGDVGLSQKQIEETQVIVTTPEKWDIITRKCGERTYTQLVGLMIFDEIHLLHDTRGPVLEALIARMHRQRHVTRQDIRLVGLSATLPNYEDVAVFMRVPLGVNGGLFVFGSHYRPVPLAQTFIGVRSKKALKRYNVLNEVCYNKMMDYAGKSQILIFVHSRKETARTAKFLKDTCVSKEDWVKFYEAESASKAILESEKDNVSSSELRDLLPFGFGIHHAGLQRSDRKLVEDLFADRHIQVLVSTSTLAWGVNLPAHTVIIKGTQVYSPELGKWRELPPLDVVQMMGRAGRPQYDTTGHGIILTQHACLQYYLSLTNQQLPIESRLISHLPDILNAEIVLGSVRHRQDAVRWLGDTYLFIRMLRSPELYGISREELAADRALIQKRIDLAHAALALLDQHRLIHYDRKSGELRTTALGKAASQYYLKHETVATLNSSLTSVLSDIDLFRLFSLVKEFSLVPVRPEEKLELSKTVERVPLPVKGQLSEPATKINVLLQAYISQLKLDGFALQADMSLVQQNAGRIMRAIFDIALRRGWSNVAQLALKYSKVVERRMWATMTPLRQFNVLPMQDIKRIERRDFPWDRYYDLKPQELGELVKNPGLGRKLHKLIHQFPRLEMSVHVQPLTDALLQFELLVTPDFEWNFSVHNGKELFWLFVEDVDGLNLLYYDQFVLTQEMADRDTTLVFSVPVDRPPSPNYFIKLISDKWIGSETCIPVCFKDIVLPVKNLPPTELLDLQPLPISALNFPEAQKILYETLSEVQASAESTMQGAVFNPIQTQTFAALYNGSDNVLLCAPPSSGRTICLEFAILGLLRNFQNPLCLYIAPYPQIVASKFRFWKERFGALGLKVSLLGGDLAADAKTMATSNLVLTVPEHWDALSRRWRTRKSVLRVQLLLVDFIHLMDDPIVGASMEAAVSRTRFISANKQIKCRIVGTGASIGNAKDVADWIGVETPGNIFNFHPNTRTISLELFIHRFDLAERQSRMLAIYQPLCHTIRHTGDKPIIVVSPDRREARLAALEILLHSAADNRPNVFRRASPESIQERIEKRGGIRESVVTEALVKGVGIVHEGMTHVEQETVKGLFRDGMIQILVVTIECVWSLHLSAYLVVIQDTEYWSSRDRQWVHYNQQTVTQILGLAGRPNIDNEEGAQVVLFCKSSKREELKRAVFEPTQVESNLDFRLADFLLSEIVTGTIKNKPDAIDWITWTFEYRRLAKNPNFYGLKKSSADLMSDFLSELIENALDSLEKSFFISIQNDLDLLPLNLGMISAFYNLNYRTIEIYNRVLTASIKHKAIVQLIASSHEVSDFLQTKKSEENLLRRIHNQTEFGELLSGDLDFADPKCKAITLLSAHFQRLPLTQDLINDLMLFLPLAHRLCLAVVDVATSNSWLRPALAAMELAQMIVQATTPKCSSLLQLPYANPDFVATAKDLGINEIFDMLSCEDATRDSLFERMEFSTSQIEEVASACNSFPVIDVEHKIEASEEGPSLVLQISRDFDDEEKPTVPKVSAPLFPVEKSEQWWIAVGCLQTNKVLAIRRIAINKPVQQVVMSLDLTGISKTKTEAGKTETEEKAPPKQTNELSIFLMSDSYIGCDQEFKFSLPE
eukprot:Gregarina_sp_Poly_1__9529@NODE_59_length_17172_cov_76_315580_g50_i0_p1_GENE_NODE_59_length_17172_cov_76_315580_g50_i0NODE_59_length_17172_cov_76_315580_g50_i0_p1_ORF_typecomplete_len2257_score414_55Sec63/PF02889_16/6_8e81Sec63/PF02889_16/1_2e62DEAD/PF00270_29/3_1e03DEAD/PF00270_29/1_6e26DEAD/PF00270_29/6_6e15DEAD/PF00270_29/1_7e03Helicase_C/PF00271_31/1_1e16Helicase_C/PF00271_31/0_00051Helicase_PWI/PF18149_1/2_9e23ResIII/PF04851_15/1_9e14ResIII/PF04851_15/1_9e03ResIII/PF04851_15/0_15Flavi_DEAD/P